MPLVSKFDFRTAFAKEYCWLIMSNTSDDAKREPNSANQRMRLIHEELDRLQLDANDRSNSVASKASFLAVASGVIITATTVQIWHVAWYVGALPLVLAAAALACATIALRPGTRIGLSAQRLSDRFLDSTWSPVKVEWSIVRDKVASMTAREANLRQRARVTTAGFIVLLAAVMALVVTYAIAISTN